MAREVMEEAGQTVDYLVGTMIELPRAVIRAHRIAEDAEFFSFGTNDLTQTTYGISRDDASAFLTTYQQKGIIDRDPFVTIDIDGVGELIRMATDKGRATRPDIKLGICGEHGGDPQSIHWTMCPAHPSACPLPNWRRHRQRWKRSTAFRNRFRQKL